MPLVGTSEKQWPPFTNEPVFGRWFWQYYNAGKVVNLGGLIAETPCTVFWAATKGILGSDCCVVAHDIETPEGLMLPRGRYVYSEALQEGKNVPSLEILLADDRKIDLAPRFQRSAAISRRLTSEAGNEVATSQTEGGPMPVPPGIGKGLCRPSQAR
jgi:hypothetical protein